MQRLSKVSISKENQIFYSKQRTNGFYQHLNVSLLVYRLNVVHLKIQLVDYVYHRVSSMFELYVKYHHVENLIIRYIYFSSRYQMKHVENAKEFVHLVYLMLTIFDDHNTRVMYQLVIHYQKFEQLEQMYDRRQLVG